MTATESQIKKWRFDLQNAAAEITRLAMLADAHSSQAVFASFHAFDGRFSVSIRDKANKAVFSKEMFGATAYTRPDEGWSDQEYEAQLAVMRQIREQLKALLEGKFKPVMPTGPEAA